MIPRCFWDVVCITLLLLNTSGECDIALDFQVRWCSRWYLSSTINFILFYLFDYKFVDLMIFSFLQGKICASQTFCAPYQHWAHNLSKLDYANHFIKLWNFSFRAKHSSLYYRPHHLKIYVPGWGPTECFVTKKVDIFIYKINQTLITCAAFKNK